MMEVRGLFLFGLVGMALMGGAVAKADDQECPHHPESTYTLPADPDSARSQLGQIAAPAKDKGAVCILAYYDASASNSKKLALRRADWAMRLLVDKGVPEGTISRELRVGDKSSSAIVQVILGP